MVNHTTRRLVCQNHDPAICQSCLVNYLNNQAGVACEVCSRPYFTMDGLPNVMYEDPLTFLNVDDTNNA